MNKEQQELLNEVYENYQWSQPKSYPAEPDSNLTQEEFIKKCKTDTEFSEKWGLTIEERELSLEERMGLCKEKWDYSWNRTINLEDIEWRMNNEWNIPTKLITITYNDKKIKSYE